MRATGAIEGAGMEPLPHRSDSILPNDSKRWIAKEDSNHEKEQKHEEAGSSQ
tara:strand:+ start:11985 stop:12140 length:156 start_codon:yes stop_codon:yes gene_type:complete